MTELIATPASPQQLREYVAAQDVPGMIIGAARSRADWAQTDALPVVDPSYGMEVCSLPLGTAAHVDRAVEVATESFEDGVWAGMAPRERGRILANVAFGITAAKERLALLESIDLGKPLQVSRADVDVSAGYFEYYAGLADKIAGTSHVLQSDALGLVLREPYGVSAQVIPFNFPMQQIGRGVAPALAAGCSVVIKPSPEASLTASLIAQIAWEAGVPDGVINVVTGGADVGAALVSHEDVDQVTFTGSVAGGIAVAQAAARNVVPTLLELGGKSPSVVMGSFDDEVVAGVGRMAFYNTGQNCGAGTRLLLQREIADDFLDKLIAWTEDLTVGPALDNPYLGPLTSARQLAKVQSYLDLAELDGGTIQTAGRVCTTVEATDGYYMAPRIITGLPPESRLFQEEIFGPVLCVEVIDTLDEAIDRSNSTEYGLAAYIWTPNSRDALRFARQVRSGGVTVNGIGVGTGIELPSGGVQKSGWGREKGATAIENYTYVKSVTLKS